MNNIIPLNVMNKEWLALAVRDWQTNRGVASATLSNMLVVLHISSTPLLLVPKGLGPVVSGMSGESSMNHVVSFSIVPLNRQLKQVLTPSLNSYCWKL